MAQRSGVRRPKLVIARRRAVSRRQSSCCSPVMSESGWRDRAFYGHVGRAPTTLHFILSFTRVSSRRPSCHHPTIVPLEDRDVELVPGYSSMMIPLNNWNNIVDCSYSFGPDSHSFGHRLRGLSNIAHRTHHSGPHRRVVIPHSGPLLHPTTIYKP